MTHEKLVTLLTDLIPEARENGRSERDGVSVESKARGPALAHPLPLDDEVSTSPVIVRELLTVNVPGKNLEQIRRAVLEAQL